MNHSETVLFPRPKKTRYDIRLYSARNTTPQNRDTAQFHLHRVMITEKESSQAPQLPVTPQMLYPLGGIRVWLVRGQKSQ